MKINDNRIVGLDAGEQEEMRYGGCGNCSDNLMGNVTKCLALFKDKEDGWDSYDVWLCHGCLCSYKNGDPLPDGCKNIYNI